MNNWETLLNEINTTEVSPFLKTRIDAKLQNTTWTGAHPLFSRIALLLGIVFLGLNLLINFNTTNSGSKASTDNYFDSSINYQIYE